MYTHKVQPETLGIKWIFECPFYGVHFTCKTERFPSIIFYTAKFYANPGPFPNEISYASIHSKSLDSFNINYSWRLYLQNLWTLLTTIVPNAHSLTISQKTKKDLPLDFSKEKSSFLVFYLVCSITTRMSNSYFFTNSLQ